MIAPETFSTAIASREPGQTLREMVLKLAAEGRPKAEIVTSLEQFLLWLRSRETTCESDEDVVLDVLDALADWCHPDAQLLPPEVNERQ